MNINLDKHEINLILDSLESYQLHIENGPFLGYKYTWSLDNVENLAKYLNGILENNNND